MPGRKEGRCERKNEGEEKEAAAAIAGLCLQGLEILKEQKIEAESEPKLRLKYLLCLFTSELETLLLH